MRRTIPTIAIVGLALAGCSTGPIPADDVVQEVPVEEQMPAPEPISLDTPQTFEYTTMTGTKGTLTIPVDPYAPMDRLYEAVGDTTVREYARVDIDNREGTEPYGLYEVNLYTPEGEKVTLEGLNNAAVAVPVSSPDDPAFELSNKITEEFFEDTAVGEARAEYAVSTGPLPDEVSRIEVVQGNAGETTQVYPEMPAGGIQ